MPRSARKHSLSGYYHVIVRGNGKQIIFEDDSDYKFYLKQLVKYSTENNISICAYCLMENHVHLLIHDSQNNLSVFMQKLGICYAGYFNQKYERVGHLFQDRFQSEIIDNEAYLLEAFRYILNNPVSAGICEVSEYMWSSYRAYGEYDSFVNTDVFVELIGDWEHYVGFLNKESSEKCYRFEFSKDDEWVKKIIKDCLGTTNGTIMQTYSKEERNRVISELKRRGLSNRQLERMTGINRNIIQRVK